MVGVPCLCEIRQTVFLGHFKFTVHHRNSQYTTDIYIVILQKVETAESDNEPAITVAVNFLFYPGWLVYLIYARFDRLFFGVISNSRYTTETHSTPQKFVLIFCGKYKQQRVTMNQQLPSSVTDEGNASFGQRIWHWKFVVHSRKMM